MVQIGQTLLRILHACPRHPNGKAGFDLDDLEQHLKTDEGLLFVTTDMHSSEALDFVRKLNADLGVVYGTRILKASLFNIPVQGSINIHKRRVPDYRGGGPVGLWELLDGQSEIGVTVHQLETTLDTGDVINCDTIAIEPYDTLTSLALKADLVGNDLIVRSVADFARKTVQRRLQISGGRVFRSPKPQQLHVYEKQLAAQRQSNKPGERRPLWKLIARVGLFLPFVAIRNWYRRARGRFPVVILYHHLVTDQTHPLGIGTREFLRQVEFLKKCYRVVSLRGAIATLKTGRVDAPTVVLTFDDGYECNFVNLRAVTEVTDVPVTLFLSTDHMTNGEAFLHDKKSGIRDFRPLSWEQVRFLSRSGFEIGSHTRSHFDCGSHDSAILRNELIDSKVELEQHLGGTVDFFSFPWGKPENMSREAVELARSTYQYVFSAFGAVNFPSRADSYWHLKRCSCPSDLFEMELQIQSILEFENLAIPAYLKKSSEK
jgi:peptidoglycan/xylan/chitin deacetylase (PgdA/CDA1 family)/folate-dependent phosphoribosylglycinamide formyltransferase PurN